MSDASRPSSPRGGQFLGLVRLSLGALADRPNIDDVVVVLAEGADIDLADEPELHRCAVGARLLFDGGDRRRQRGLHVGEIEPQRRSNVSVILSLLRSTETAISPGSSNM